MCFFFGFPSSVAPLQVEFSHPPRGARFPRPIRIEQREPFHVGRQSACVARLVVVEHGPPAPPPVVPPRERVEAVRRRGPRLLLGVGVSVHKADVEARLAKSHANDMARYKATGEVVVRQSSLVPTPGEGEIPPLAGTDDLDEFLKGDN